MSLKMLILAFFPAFSLGKILFSMQIRPEEEMDVSILSISSEAKYLSVSVETPGQKRKIEMYLLVNSSIIGSAMVRFDRIASITKGITAVSTGKTFKVQLKCDDCLE